MAIIIVASIIVVPHLPTYGTVLKQSIRFPTAVAILLVLILVLAVLAILSLQAEFSATITSDLVVFSTANVTVPYFNVYSSTPITFYHVFITDVNIVIDIGVRIRIFHLASTAVSHSCIGSSTPEALNLVVVKIGPPLVRAFSLPVASSSTAETYILCTRLVYIAMGGGLIGIGNIGACYFV